MIVLQCNPTPYIKFLFQFFMDTAKLPKFKWNELSELNSGHTENEWGAQKKKSNPITFVSYTVSWDI